MKKWPKKTIIFSSIFVASLGAGIGIGYGAKKSEQVVINAEVKWTGVNLSKITSSILEEKTYNELWLPLIKKHHLSSIFTKEVLTTMDDSWDKTDKSGLWSITYKGKDTVFKFNVFSSGEVSSSMEIYINESGEVENITFLNNDKLTTVSNDEIKKIQLKWEKIFSSLNIKES